MADALILRLLTPQRQLCDGPAAQVTAEGTLGQFTVLPDHVTFLTTLEPGAVSFRSPGGGEQAFAVKGGYAEVRDNVVTVLADDALPIDGVDGNAARADHQAAEAALAGAPYGQPDHERLGRELRWAEVRLELSTLSRAGRTD